LATKIVPGILREVWRASTALDGGASEAIPTGIACTPGALSRVQAFVLLDQVANAPDISAALSIANRKLVVTLTNAAGVGNSAMWTLDVTRNHSIQQARGASPAPVLVVGGNGGFGSFEDQLVERAKRLTGIRSPQVTFDDYTLGTIDFTGAAAPLGYQDFLLALHVPPIYSMTDQTAILASSSPVAGHFCEVLPCGTGAWKTTSVRTTPWYVGFKARMETGIDIDGRIGLVIQDDTGGTNNIEIGALGHGSLVNFSVTVGNPAAPEVVIDSGVPLDNNAHVFEVWRGAGNLILAIDGVIVGNCPVPTGWSGVSMVSVPYANNGGIAAERAGVFFWYLLLAESE
jgi:hypothetical protein